MEGIAKNLLVSLVYFFIYTFIECEVITACDADHEVYSHVDCDGDGILDHACRTTINEKHWLILSSEGCPNDWGTSDRSVSECPAAWPSKGNENQVCCKMQYSEETNQSTEGLPLL